MSSRRERIATVAERSRLSRIYQTRPLWHGVLVLNYHRIGNHLESPLDRNVFSGTPEDLARHIGLIRRYADLVDPADLPALLAPGAPRGRFVAITFDDGYRDNHDLALPVLQAHDARAAFFIPSGFIDRPRLTWYDEIAWMLRHANRPSIRLSPWLTGPLSLDPADRDATIARVTAIYPTLREDRERTSRYLDDIAVATGAGRAPVAASHDLWMTWDHVRAVRDAGMTIGGHTSNHPALADLAVPHQRREIIENRDRLTAELGAAPTLFAYPFGGRHQFTPDTAAILAEAGYDLGFSFYGGYNRPGRVDRYDVRRLYVSFSTTDAGLTGLLTLPQVFGFAPPARRP
jgi:peptidoglycan/xylan/chitin deacetylase (PgdA/CDA1 family)